MAVSPVGKLTFAFLSSREVEELGWHVCHCLAGQGSGSCVAGCATHVSVGRAWVPLPGPFPHIFRLCWVMQAASFWFREGCSWRMWTCLFPGPACLLGPFPRRLGPPGSGHAKVPSQHGCLLAWCLHPGLTFSYSNFQAQSGAFGQRIPVLGVLGHPLLPRLPSLGWTSWPQGGGDPRRLSECRQGGAGMPEGWSWP